MKKAMFWVNAAGLCAFAALAIACSAIGAGVDAAKHTMSLTYIGQAYKSYCTSNNKGPANADDLLKSATTKEEKDAIQEIKDGKFTIIWGVNLKDPTSAGGNSAVLGYSATPFTGPQRVILKVDGTCEVVPESTFTGLTKAKPGGITK